MSDTKKITLPEGQSSAWYEFNGPSAAELEEKLRDFYTRIDYTTLEVSSPSLSLDHRAIKAMNAEPLRLIFGPWTASVHVQRYRYR